jgi:hypothetical protein
VFRMAHSWKPDEACFVSLPYVQALAPNNVAFAPQLLQTLLEEYTVRRVLQGIKNEAALSRAVREREEVAIEAATKAVSRHYRKTSVTLHPDRYGNQFQVEFEALKEAYFVVGDPESRHSYIEAMIGVLEALGRNTPLIQEAHNTWARDHHVSQQEANRLFTALVVRETRHFYLEGGLAANCPQSIVIRSANITSRVVHLGLRMLHPHHEFRNCCTSICIVAAEGGGVEGRKILELRGKQLKKAMADEGNDMIEVEVTLPHHDIWAVHW